MKRVVAIFLLVVMTCSLSACHIGTSTIKFKSYARYEHADIHGTKGTYAATLPSCYKIGYEFVCWSYSEDEVDPVPEPFYFYDDEVTLYAVYEIDEEEFINYTIDLGDYSREVMLLYSKNYIHIKNPNNTEISSLEVIGDVECAYMSAYNHLGRPLGEVEDSNRLQINKTNGDIVLELDALFEGHITIKVKPEG